MCGPKIRYARNNEIAIAYAVIGTGPDDLLYLSPYNNLDIVWENPLYQRFLRRLSSSSRLIVIERRGTAVSDRYSADDPPVPEDLVDDLEAVLDEVGLSAPRCSASQTREPCARCSPPPIRSAYRA